MTNILGKNELRDVSLPLPQEQILAVQGKLAEILRRSADYRLCRQIFIDPSLLLRQCRINALLDGKELIMPGAGLKEGFYLLKPFVIPFRKLLMGVTYAGLDYFGSRLSSMEIASLDISLLIGESYAVDRQGYRLGDGQGFFDLAVAMLHEIGGLTENCQVIAAVDTRVKIVDNVPREPWDIQCTKILGPDGLEELSASSPVTGIFWDDLAMERIKRMSPLWKLHCNRE